jgi:hypothetical protein
MPILDLARKATLNLPLTEKLLVFADVSEELWLLVKKKWTCYNSLRLKSKYKEMSEMSKMNLPGFTAEASLPMEGDSWIYRKIQLKFDNRSLVVPARSFLGDIICEGLLRGCFDDNIPGACGIYGDWCTLGGIFE